MGNNEFHKQASTIISMKALTGNGEFHKQA